MRTKFVLIATLWIMVCGTAAEWPGREWAEEKPAKMGLDEAQLIKARDYAVGAGGSGLIVFRGKAAMRWGDQEKLYDIKSATKSIGATALGIAVGDGKIELDAPLVKYHSGFGVPPESNNENGWPQQITVRHLATQAGGFEKAGGFGQLLAEPGTRWIYSDADRTGWRNASRWFTGGILRN